MPLPVPMLDDRTFQQIVDEVRKRIPLYCPEWTDHNVSDPGITLIELFAWMTELLIYRLNQVPELHYVKFAEFLGLQRQPPRAAVTRITFWLSQPFGLPKERVDVADQEAPNLPIAAYTQVSTIQTETEAPIIFTTEQAFTIHAPRFQNLMVEQFSGQQSTPPRPLPANDLQKLFEGSDRLKTFSDEPREGEALYFGFTNDLSYHIIRFDLMFDEKAGIGINVKHPPYVWEAYSAKGDWEQIEADPDTTKGMNARNGSVVLHLPQLHSWQPGVPTTEQAARLAPYWVRVRIKPISEYEEMQGMRPYNKTPELLQIVQVVSVGCSISASNVSVVLNEHLGTSDGSPGQHFQLSGSPILQPLQPNERLRVQFDEKRYEYWENQPDFSQSDFQSQHFVIDSLAGIVRLGPAVRQPNGEIRAYGKIPTRGAELILERYRYGGGIKGNLPPKAISVLRSSIPYVARVENRVRASGGLDAQGVDDLEMAVQRLLRTRRVAVTPEDFVSHILQHFDNDIARVHCIPLRKKNESSSKDNASDKENPKDKSGVRILVIPRLKTNDAAATDIYLTDAMLNVDDKLRKQIETYLEDFRLLTYRVSVENPQYARVKVKLKVEKRIDVDVEPLRVLIEKRLFAFFHPVTGGLEGRGWRFQKTSALALSDVERGLAGISRLEGVEQLKVVELTLGENRTTTEEGKPIQLEETELPVADRTHTIEIA